MRGRPSAIGRAASIAIVSASVGDAERGSRRAIRPRLHSRAGKSGSADMTERNERLTPASRADLANALAFALLFEGRRRKNDADEMLAKIVAKRLVDHLERAGFVVMKRPPIIGAAAIARGHEG